MHKYPQNQSSVGSMGQTLTTNVSMNLCNWQICHQTHVLCDCTACVPHQIRYQNFLVPTPAVAWPRVWLLQRGGSTPLDAGVHVACTANHTLGASRRMLFLSWWSCMGEYCCSLLGFWRLFVVNAVNGWVSGGMASPPDSMGQTDLRHDAPHIHAHPCATTCGLTGALCKGNPTALASRHLSGQAAPSATQEHAARHGQDVAP